MTAHRVTQRGLMDARRMVLGQSADQAAGQGDEQGAENG